MIIFTPKRPVCMCFLFDFVLQASFAKIPCRFFLSRPLPSVTFRFCLCNSFDVSLFVLHYRTYPMHACSSHASTMLFFEWTNKQGGEASRDGGFCLSLFFFFLFFFFLLLLFVCSFLLHHHHHCPAILPLIPRGCCYGHVQPLAPFWLRPPVLCGIHLFPCHFIPKFPVSMAVSFLTSCSFHVS